MRTPQKYAFRIDIDFKFGEAGDTLKKFLFSYECDFVKEFRGYNVFWIRGWIRILGFSIGAAIFLRFSEIEKPSKSQDSEG